jgi:hypothetical protein
MQAIGRPPEMQLLSNRYEVAKLPKLNRILHDSGY